MMRLFSPRRRGSGNGNTADARYLRSLNDPGAWLNPREEVTDGPLTKPTELPGSNRTTELRFTSSDTMSSEELREATERILRRAREPLAQEGFALNQGPAADTIVLAPVREEIVPEAVIEDEPVLVEVQSTPTPVPPTPQYADPNLQRAIDIAHSDNPPSGAIPLIATTAILIMVSPDHFILALGSLPGLAWTLTSQSSSDELLLSQSLRRTTQWEWMSGFLTCAVEPDR